MSLLVVSGVVEAAFTTNEVGHPSEDFFRDLAQIEVGLLIAYSVATGGASLRAGERIEDHLNWLGGSCATGLAGLIGVGFSVALAASREAGHAGAIDLLGLAWILISGLCMGLLVALLPYAAWNWSRPARSASGNANEPPQAAPDASG